MKVKRGLRRLQPPDYAAEDGKTALYSAAFTGNTGLTHLLCDFDADLEAADTEHGHRPLHVAALHGWSDVVDILIDRKATVDARDKRGRTPLHYASLNNHIDCIRVLLDHGLSDIKLTDNDSWTRSYLQT